MRTLTLTAGESGTVGWAIQACNHLQDRCVGGKIAGREMRPTDHSILVWFAWESKWASLSKPAAAPGIFSTIRVADRNSGEPDIRGLIASRNSGESRYEGAWFRNSFSALPARSVSDGGDPRQGRALTTFLHFGRRRPRPADRQPDAFAAEEKTICGGYANRRHANQPSRQAQATSRRSSRACAWTPSTNSSKMRMSSADAALHSGWN